MTTPKLRTTLLTIGAAMAVLGAVLLVFTRDPSGAAGVPESCGPQELTVTETTALVDPAGCAVQLVVWEAAPDAVEQCLPAQTEGCIMLPEVNPVTVSGTGPLSADLPCGWYQVDVFDADVALPGAETPIDPSDDTLTQEFLDTHPEFWFNLLAGDSGTRVCEPVTPPVTPPVPEAPPAPAPVPVVVTPRTAG